MCDVKIARLSQELAWESSISQGSKVTIECQYLASQRHRNGLYLPLAWATFHEVSGASLEGHLGFAIVIDDSLGSWIPENAL